MFVVSNGRENKYILNSKTTGLYDKQVATSLIIRIQGSGKSTAKLSELQITRSRSSDERSGYQPKCVVDGCDELS